MYFQQVNISRGLTGHKHEWSEWSETLTHSFEAQIQESNMLRGTADLQPLRISRSLAIAGFSMKVSLCLCGEGCMRLAHRSVLKQTNVHICVEKRSFWPKVLYCSLMPIFLWRTLEE